jgi:midasin
VQAYTRRNSITKDETESNDDDTSNTDDSEGNAAKRRRTDTTITTSSTATTVTTTNTAQTTAAALMESNEVLALQAQLHELTALATRCKGMFEWQDGPLVTAMQQGHILLLDELSLAEDAVLERLNSVLEPSRKLVLAEKGGSGNNSVTQELTAVKEFCMLATMNPGGDFGKRELSPALRSRFTEIWVPAIARYQDLHAVLAQVLSSSSTSVPRSLSMATAASETSLTELVAPMLQFVAWFNSGMTNATGSDATTAAATAALTSAPATQSFQGSSSSSLFMSLRDMLAWANFIVDTVSSTNTTTATALSPWLAYAHGAALVVLDGLGLGTGLSYTEVTRLRVTATAFLTAYIPQAQRDEATAQLQEVDVTAGLTAATTLVQQCDTAATDSTAAPAVRSMFGAAPFYIETGPLDISSLLQFSLGAPTTARNLKRVLRAMQLKKAILLEGSPGVGKTSLISALAAAAGHALVRINLSEQTDLSDLMGSDLPMPDTTAATNDTSDTADDRDSGSSSATGAARFAWCDGVFLRALRAGHWVLLDELNLASQTVLEGLNACLDHRAEVFIPELGQSFKCPATFRVFAAQNPLGQGGGRKGMPKSFLNRFTKVFIDALTPADLIHIASGRFPMLAPPSQQPQSVSGSDDDDDDDDAMDVDSEQHSDGIAASAATAVASNSIVSYIGGVSTDHLLEKMIRFNRYMYLYIYIYICTVCIVDLCMLYTVRYTSANVSRCSCTERERVVRLMRKTSLYNMTHICVTVHYQRE